MNKLKKNLSGWKSPGFRPNSEKNLAILAHKMVDTDKMCCALKNLYTIFQVESSYLKISQAVALAFGFEKLCQKYKSSFYIIQDSSVSNFSVLYQIDVKSIKYGLSFRNLDQIVFIFWFCCLCKHNSEMNANEHSTINNSNWYIYCHFFLSLSPCMHIVYIHVHLFIHDK